jgi:mRNA-degrading endonuclease toxin of MazEF toxin-antitoxin module
VLVVVDDSLDDPGSALVVVEVVVDSKEAGKEVSLEKGDRLDSVIIEKQT